jgi:hypothetical protein
MKLAAVLFSSALALGVAVSCSDDPTPHPCTGIPTGGCPLSYGVACEDPSCTAVYRCLPNNQWELDHMCPPLEAGAPEAGLPASDAGDASAPPFDADIDAPPGAFGGPGCDPLQAPDCPLGTALACGTSCCGCEDLFVCQNGGWSAWGYCGDAGPVPAP